jgi:DNA-binding transcriptional LysR family regulator
MIDYISDPEFRCMAMLDLTDVTVFLTIADLGSFTRAAEALGTTQPIISTRLKKLEATLGRRLVERHPRLVRLSAAGEQFLPSARDLIAAHERALQKPVSAPVRLRLGISEHVAGRDLPEMLGRIAAVSPQVQLEVRLGLSAELLVAFDAGELGAVVVRSDAARREGEFLRNDAFGWFAAPGWHWQGGTPLPLITLSQACNIRAVAAKALDEAGIASTDAFLGGGINAVTAAVSAGLGVSPLARRIAPLGALEVGPALGLPALPVSRVMLHAQGQDPALHPVLRTLAAYFRG